MSQSEVLHFQRITWSMYFFPFWTGILRVEILQKCWFTLNLELKFLRSCRSDFLHKSLNLEFSSFRGKIIRKKNKWLRLFCGSKNSIQLFRLFSIDDCILQENEWLRKPSVLLRASKSRDSPKLLRNATVVDFHDLHTHFPCNYRFDLCNHVLNRKSPVCGIPSDWKVCVRIHIASKSWKVRINYIYFEFRTPVSW